MRRPRAAVSFARALIVAAAGCTALVDDNLTGGGPADAGEAAPDATTAEASANDGAVDVSTDAPPEASEPDAPGALDAGADAKGCAALLAPTFCDDFDQGALGARWSVVDPGVNMFGLDDASVHSAPLAFLQTIPAADAGDQSSTFRRTIIGTYTVLHTSAHIRIDTLSQTDLLSWVPIGFYTDGVGVGLELDMTPSATKLVETSYDFDAGVTPFYEQKELTQHVAVGVWTQVEVHLDLAMRKVTVYVDGMVVLDKALAAAYPATANESAIDLGQENRQGPHPAAAVRFDTVAFWVK